MQAKTIKQISQETQISQRTLHAQAKKLGFSKIAGAYMLSPREEKQLLNNSLHKVSKTLSKEPLTIKNYTLSNMFY